MRPSQAHTLDRWYFTYPAGLLAAFTAMVLFISLVFDAIDREQQFNEASTRNFLEWSKAHGNASHYAAQ